MYGVILLCMVGGLTVPFLENWNESILQTSIEPFAIIFHWHLRERHIKRKFFERCLVTFAVYDWKECLSKIRDGSYASWNYDMTDGAQAMLGVKKVREEIVARWIQTFRDAKYKIPYDGPWLYQIAELIMKSMRALQAQWRIIQCEPCSWSQARIAQSW